MEKSKRARWPTSATCLLKNLGTLSLIKIRLTKDGPVYARTTNPTPLQARAFKLINVQIAAEAVQEIQISRKAAWYKVILATTV